MAVKPLQCLKALRRCFVMERLPSWMEVVNPDPIVLSERLDESLFAADLYRVLKGDAPREYQDPPDG